ncbi:MAG TPA: hypothetical protein VEW48_04340 [Thermoanaerobaculia bacterium]|nr:hypothetical protein [Thermoanaerobaculia bacterium]
MKSRACVLVPVLLVLSVLATGPAAFGGQFTDQVRAQLLIAGVALLNGGFELVDQDTGHLHLNRYEDLRINLRGNRNYIFTGVCDQDCGDLDLYLYDENDNLIAKDEELDDYPMVSVTPAWNGEFVVRVRMAQCTNQPCFYGLGTFRK